MRSAGHPRRHIGWVVRAVGEQGGGEATCHRPLAGAGRAMKQIGVGWSARWRERATEYDARVGMRLDARQCLQRFG